MPRIFGPIVKPGVSFSTTKLANVGACAVGRLGAGQQRHAERHVGAGVGDERLAAVDQPAAVAALGPGADAARVGAGVGLGQAERAEHASLGQRPQPALALRVVAEEVAAAATRWSRAPATRPPPTGRPGRSAPSRRRSRRSTCRCRPTPRGSACRAGPSSPISRSRSVGHRASSHASGRARRDLLLREVAAQADQVAFRLGEREVHGRILLDRPVQRLLSIGP